jgi:hypothetical protein
MIREANHSAESKDPFQAYTKRGPARSLYQCVLNFEFPC